MSDQRTMTDNEKLIEEAAKAMYFEDCGVAALADDAEPFREMAHVALAVFEKAHTPTDDEREALVINYCPEHGDLLDGPRSIRCNEAHTVEDIRRTVQGEPRITIEHEGGNTVTGTPEQVLNHGHLKPGWKYRGSEPQGEPSDAQVEAALNAWYASGHRTASVGMRAALRAAGEVRR